MSLVFLVLLQLGLVAKMHLREYLVIPLLQLLLPTGHPLFPTEVPYIHIPKDSESLESYPQGSRLENKSASNQLPTEPKIPASF